MNDLHMNFNYASPGELRAISRFLNDLAEVREKDIAEQRIQFAKNCSYSEQNQALGSETIVAGSSLESSATQAVAETSAALRAPTSAPKARATKKTAPVEEPKKEAEETCLDVKPSAEAQQELPLKTAAEIGYEPAAPELTIDDLRRHLRAYGQSNGAEALSSLYAEYGAKQLSDLPADKYAEIIAKVSA